MSKRLDDLPHSPPLSSTDQALIAALRADARLPVAALAHRLGVSRATVTARLRRLEDLGVITGYTIQLRPDAEPDQIVAWISIAIEGNENRKVVASLLGEPAVSKLIDTNGRWDLLAELRAAHLPDLAQVLERIRLIKGIASSETSIHLSRYRV